MSIAGPLGSKGGAAPGEAGRNVDHMCLRVEPFDAAAILRHLQELDVPHDTEVHINFGAEGTGPSIYLDDPDGNVVELKGAEIPNHR